MKFWHRLAYSALVIPVIVFVAFWAPIRAFLDAVNQGGGLLWDVWQ